jgi:hypothetical protein
MSAPLNAPLATLAIIVAMTIRGDVRSKNLISSMSEHEQERQ